jgi:Flp pilus assembly protein TadG
MLIGGGMRRKLIRAAENKSGQTLLMFVLFMIALFLFAGLGIDLGFAYITRARLSKGVDSACLTGMRNLSQGTVTAGSIAKSAFLANYGVSGRDVAAPVPNVNFSIDAANNRVIDVDATATINTFFIRVLPLWATLKVGASAEAMRTRLIMALVLDRSGSMGDDGGMTALKKDVPIFIDFFDDTADRVSLNSFSSAARVDFPVGQPFIAPIKTAVASFSADGHTCAEQGLVKGFQQNQSVTILPGENVIKVIVFFTDGIANTWQTSFNCGVRNIDEGKTLYDPITGNSGGAVSSGCTVPPNFASISPPPAAVASSSSSAMITEAEKRAEEIARQARVAGNLIYSIGLGNDKDINKDFLQRVANADGIVDPNQPEGLAVFAPTADDIKAAFDKIYRDIQTRLTK